MAITRIGPNQSVNLASNVTGTLPVGNGGTAITSGFINGTATPGKVLQVVEAQTTTQTNIASTSYADTTLTASITPSATSSKILVIISQANYVYRATNVRVVASIQLLRASSSIFESVGASGVQAGTASNGYLEVWNQTPIQYLDSPSSTSSVTYKTQMKVENTGNSATVRCQAAEPQGSGKSNITLIEIAG